MKPIPLILDCDPGHDDALAMILAAHNPSLKLLGVTTVSGNGGIAKVTLNARRVATLAGINVPIAEGAGKAILGAIEEAHDIHGESALDGAELPQPKIELSELHAVDLIAKLVSEHPEPVTLVATGPLTNIALFLKMYPQLKNQVSEIVFMGGSASRGNRTPYAEFNIWMDPEAADVVLRSGLPLTMCGLDVTHQALVTKQIFAKLEEMQSELSKTIIGLLKFFAKTYDDVFEMPDPPLHDPVAIALLIDRSVVKSRFVNVQVELSGPLTRGATVVDIYNRLGEAANCNVALELDFDKFWSLMLDAIKAAAITQ
ncbi:MAG: nucleoside hydrolase [Candidatus Nanopelagicaceae bacterium]|nr:nucleoside hydrolase [Candidatus Nanopelagicaceae bacterium]